MSGRWQAQHATINCWWQLGGRRREKEMSSLRVNKGGGTADTILWKILISSKSTPNLQYTLPGAEKGQQPIPHASREEDCSISAMMGSCLGPDQGTDWMGDINTFFCHNLQSNINFDPVIGPIICLENLLGRPIAHSTHISFSCCRGGIHRVRAVWKYHGPGLIQFLGRFLRR